MDHDVEDKSLERCRANLRDALRILESKNINSEIISHIITDVQKFSDWNEVPMFEYKEDHGEEM
jgi:hypothetical protein